MSEHRCSVFKVPDWPEPNWYVTCRVCEYEQCAGDWYLAMGDARAHHAYSSARPLDDDRVDSILFDEMRLNFKKPITFNDANKIATLYMDDPFREPVK